jgi:hypothetical protein
MENSIYRLNFAESSLPTFKENKAKGFITFGADNLYPNTLIDLFNKSPKHSAIVTQKAAYLAGDKTEIIGQNTADIAKAQEYMQSINSYESFDALKKKITQDIELFDGFAIEIIWNKAKTAISEIYHLPFQNVRCSIDGHYLYAEDWSDRRVKPEHYYGWNPKTRESKQVLYYKYYRAGQDIYPLPSYVGALKYIEIDTEISNFHLNSIKSGFSAQTLIQLYKGLPTPSEARQTIKRFKENFTGSDNAGGVIIQFNDPNETPSTVDNLAPSDFDKLFMQLNEQVQQEIFSGHRVTSPMLFGIKTEGQLGGRNELIEAFEAFQTSYVEPRQDELDEVLTDVFKYIAPVRLETTNRPPIGLDYADLYQKGLMSLDEARQEIGFAKQRDQKTVVDSINNLSPLVANKVIEQMTVNEIRNIAGLPPILGGDQPSKPAAEFSKENPFGWNDDKDMEVFEQFGDSKDTFEIHTFEFASALGLMILQFLQGSEGLVIADLIENINAPAEDIIREVERLSQDNMIESEGDALKVSERGSNELRENNITTELEVRYEYAKAFGISGSEIIPTSRDFCVRLSSLNRLYTREEIDQMSAILGYDVWRRRGGWMTVKGTNDHVPYCRHQWRSRLVRKKI